MLFFLMQRCIVFVFLFVFVRILIRFTSCIYKNKNLSGFYEAYNDKLTKNINIKIYIFFKNVVVEY